MGSYSPGMLFHAIRSPLAGAVLAGAVGCGVTGHAWAQGAVKSVHNDWQVRCDTPPGAQGEQCALIQSVTAEDRANVGLTVIVLKTADQKSRLMRVVAPVGVLLPSGLGLKIDQVDVAACPMAAWPKWSWTTTWSSRCALARPQPSSSFRRPKRESAFR